MDNSVTRSIASRQIPTRKASWLILSYVAAPLCALLVASCAGTPSHATATPLIDMVTVPAGTFLMGSEEGKAPERPVHEVTVGTFRIGRTEVTQGQWTRVMGVPPTADAGSGPDYPVYNVSWTDAIAFCNALSALEGLKPCYTGSGAAVTCDFSADGYRLPTEAEWEFAARGGAGAAQTPYSGSDNAGEVAWYTSVSGNESHPVASLTPNALGLYDMSGNVWEWCWDWYDAKYYAASSAKDPAGPQSGMYRVLRGGSRGTNEAGLTVSNRYFGAHRSDSSTGFRVARSGS